MPQHCINSLTRHLPFMYLPLLTLWLLLLQRSHPLSMPYSLQVEKSLLGYQLLDRVRRHGTSTNKGSPQNSDTSIGSQHLSSNKRSCQDIKSTSSTPLRRKNNPEAFLVRLPTKHLAVLMQLHQHQKRKQQTQQWHQKRSQQLHNQRGAAAAAATSKYALLIATTA